MSEETVMGEQSGEDRAPRRDFFGNVESRKLQADALRALADATERGDVMSCVSIVITRKDDDSGPRSEYSEWRDAAADEVKDPQKNKLLSRILVYHLTGGAGVVRERVIRDEIYEHEPKEPT